MKAHYRRVIACVSFALLVACAPFTSAQETAVGEIAVHLAQIIAKSRKPALSKSPVIVLDFSETGGEVTQLGVALADQFSQALAVHAAGFEVLDRAEFRRSLTLQRIKPSAFQEKAAALCSADTAGADLFVMGILTPSGESALLRLRLVRAVDDKQIGEVSQLIPLSLELRKLVRKSVVDLPPVSFSDSPHPRPGSNGIGYPSCEFCPAPQFTEAARHARLSGSVILRVTVTAQGRVENILALTGAPCGITDQAIAAVKM